MSIERQTPTNKKGKSILTTLAALAVLALGNYEARAQVSIDLVQIGNAGNLPDTTYHGSVSYDYSIGKYDVTIGQYTAFLNAVDPTGTNPNGIYNTSMETDLNVAGISYTAGDAAGTKYAVMNNGGDSANRPITYVSWFDAARFSNWLANGQGSGITETGAYTLNGATSGASFTKNAVNPNTGQATTFWIPSLDEWYKAAYYDPNKEEPGVGGYWLYPTMSDTTPGNTIGDGGNQANCYNGMYSVTRRSSWSDSQNYLTDVGAFSGSGSAYGTYDQGGNVRQWDDQVVGGLYRVYRGGLWNGEPSLLDKGVMAFNDPEYEDYGVGFRVAGVPEPSTTGLVLLVGAGGLVWKRRRVPL